MTMVIEMPTTHSGFLGDFISTRLRYSLETLALERQDQGPEVLLLQQCRYVSVLGWEVAEVYKDSTVDAIYAMIPIFISLCVVGIVVA
jgi:hypothetical protein